MFDFVRQRRNVITSNAFKENVFDQATVSWELVTDFKGNPLIWLRASDLLPSSTNVSCTCREESVTQEAKVKISGLSTSYALHELITADVTLTLSRCLLKLIQCDHYYPNFQFKGTFEAIVEIKERYKPS